MLSARIDYQKCVEPISHDNNAVVIGCASASDSANVSGWMTVKSEPMFANQLGAGGGKATIACNIKSLFFRLVLRPTRVFPPTASVGRILRCSHLKAVRDERSSRHRLRERIHHGRIAVTPLHFDLTAERGMEELRGFDLTQLLQAAE